MWNAPKTAARILCAPLLIVWIAAPPAVAQQPPAAPQQQPAAAPQQPSSPPQSATQPQSSTPQTTGQRPAPAPAIAPPFYGGDGFSVTLQYWLGTGHPQMRTGRATFSGVSTDMDYGGTPRPMPSAMMSFPLPKHNAIRVSYFRIQGSGNSTTNQAINVYGTSYLEGDYLATHYNLQNVKISLDYLSWPFPVKDSKFHIKTLWEMQYTTIATGLDAPLRHGQTDASGAGIVTQAYGSNWFFYPSFGLGIDYLATHNFRFEARASGFAFPHRSTVWDAEASLNYRFGKLELQAGAKAFHFKTSPGQEQYIYATYPGAFVGLRWYLDFGRH